MKNNILKFLAMILIASMMLGNIPASAATTTTVAASGSLPVMVLSAVSTESKLEDALKKKNSDTVTFSTKKEILVIIDDVSNSQNKKLVINAPNATVENYSKVASVSIKAVKAYSERGSENVTISGKNVKFSVGDGNTVEKLTITGTNAEISLGEKASIKKLVANKKSGKLTIDAGFLSYCDITLKKKASLKVKGSENSNVNITVESSGSSVETSIPVSLLAKAKSTVTLKKGAENSSLKTSGKKVKLTIKDKTSSSASSDDSEGVNLTALVNNPPAPKELKKLTDKAEVHENVNLNLIDGHYVMTTREEVRDYIYTMTKGYVGFSLAVESFDLISDPSYYLEIFPAIETLELSKPKIYNNCCDIRCTVKKKVSTTDKEHFDIDNAISNGYTGYLDSEEKELYNLIYKLADKLKGDTEYDTVKNIHDYLISTITYSKDAKGNVYSIRNALIEKKCVCSGYALAFTAICKAANIGVYYVVGDAVKDGNGVLHAWNKVRINGKWYSIDVTWDDPTPDVPGEIKYNYFLLADEDMAYNHVWDDEGFPVASSRDLGIPYKDYADTKKFSKDEKAVEYIKGEIEKSRKNANGGFSIELEVLSTDGQTLYNDLKELLAYYHDTYGCGGAYSCNDRGFLGKLGYIKIYRSY